MSLTNLDWNGLANNPGYFVEVIPYETFSKGIRNYLSRKGTAARSQLGDPVNPRFIAEGLKELGLKRAVIKCSRAHAEFLAGYNEENIDETFKKYIYVEALSISDYCHVVDSGGGSELIMGRDIAQDFLGIFLDSMAEDLTRLFGKKFYMDPYTLSIVYTDSSGIEEKISSFFNELNNYARRTGRKSHDSIPLSNIPSWAEINFNPPKTVVPLGAPENWKPPKEMGWEKRVEIVAESLGIADRILAPSVKHALRYSLGGKNIAPLEYDARGLECGPTSLYKAIYCSISSLNPEAFTKEENLSEMLSLGK